jgi:hypothetical protein
LDHQELGGDDVTRHDDWVRRLIAAGLCPDVAAKVAAHPGGPVIIGPGVVVSVFDPAEQLGQHTPRRRSCS